MKSKNNRKKQKRIFRRMSDLLRTLAKDLPKLFDSLVESWEAPAIFLDDVAESVLRSRPLRIRFEDGRAVDFAKYEMLGPKGIVILLEPYSVKSLAMHSPLMDHLDEGMTMRLRAGAGKYDAAWSKLYAAIGCRFPSLISKCMETESHRLQMHNLVADLYLGERPPVIDGNWRCAYDRLVADLAEIRQAMETTEGGAFA